MANPPVLFTLAILAVVSTAAAAGNATASPSAAAGKANATASPAKNTTAPFGTNHAVGDGAGWFFDWKANASAANYSSWAANRTFYLGDYLSFKTDTGNTVVHTTNATAYRRLCGAGVAAANGSSGWKPEAAFLAVMLTAEGANYFFSDAGDGEHCRKGMRFEVAVGAGVVLRAALRRGAGGDAGRRGCYRVGRLGWCLGYSTSVVKSNMFYFNKKKKSTFEGRKIAVS